jgi:hypothetical protein
MAIAKLTGVDQIVLSLYAMGLATGSSQCISRR